ncbi:MAG: hypothetical protein DRI32_03965 [Chloroflexi bacterium]|nr:MAG: hypothetical protein DRI32_03965 [Chloroflexota bacterium]
MHPRPLELFDLPKLPRYRDKVLALDSRRALTRGNPLRAESFLSYLNPKRRIYTAISEDEEGTVLGGIIQRAEETFARLAYLAPARAPLALIDHLAAHAGTWQARQIVTEISETSPLFQSLRQCGFSVYSRQRIWDLSEISPPANLPALWREEKEIDLIPIQHLQREIVPPLLQQVEFFAPSSTGMICQADELLAYVDSTHGSQGIFLRPLIHPNTDDMRKKLLSLLVSLPNRHSLPVYLCVRSYQTWIEPILEEIGAKASESQAVMVKHLVSKVREEKTVPVRGEKVWANPAATIQHFESDE